MKTFLKVDYHVQTFFLIIMGATLPLIFIPMLLLIVFGGWQLLSGVLTALYYKQLDRKKYLIRALGYVFFLFIGYQLTEANLLPDFFVNAMTSFFVFWIILPFAIGVWYYRMVRKDYYHYCAEITIASNTMEANSPMEKEEMVKN